MLHGSITTVQCTLNERFFNLLQFKKLDDTELAIARHLLQQGADPNFRLEPYGTTCIERATFNRDLPFLKLLIEYGAQADNSGVCDWIVDELQRSNPEYLRLRWKEINSKRGELPVQMATNYLLKNYFDPDAHEICNLLFNASEMAQAEYNRIKEQAEKLCEELYFIIRNEWIRAKTEGKGLMVLIGESHEDVNPILIQSMIANLFSKLFDSVSVLTEQNDKIYAYLEKEGKRLTRGNMWGASLTLHHLIKNVLNGTIVPIDQGHFGPATEINEEPNFDPESETGIQYRNDIMIKESNMHSRGNVITVVGLNHLYGLIKKSKLSDNFIIVALNASGIVKKDVEKYRQKDEYQNQCLDYALSDDVIQASIIPATQEYICTSMLTPDKLVEIGLNCVNSIRMTNIPFEEITSSSTTFLSSYQSKPLFKP